MRSMAKRVLVVDDAIFMRNMIKDIFASGGFEVVGEAANGLEAVEKFRELKPDLTTMDIVMPFKSGIEATREIIKADNNAVVIMCSALGQESLVMEAIEATEHLEALGQDLVRVEKERTTELVDSMFRHAHSVKGMAASMGFETIAT